MLVILSRKIKRIGHYTLLTSPAVLQILLITNVKKNVCHLQREKVINIQIHKLINFHLLCIIVFGQYFVVYQLFPTPEVLKDRPYVAYFIDLAVINHYLLEHYCNNLTQFVGSKPMVVLYLLNLGVASR